MGNRDQLALGLLALSASLSAQPVPVAQPPTEEFLHRAIYAGDHARLVEYRENGWCVWQEDRFGNLPIEVAVLVNDKTAIATLLAARYSRMMPGTRFERRALETAIEFERLDMIEFVLGLGTVPLDDQFLEYQLFLATLFQRPRIVKALLDAGVSGDAVFRGDIPVFLAAVPWPDTTGIEWFVEHGADLSRVSYDGRSALDICLSAGGSLAMLELLLKRSPELAASSPERPPSGSRCETREHLRMMMAHGYDPFRVDRDGNTSLHHAVQVYNENGVRLFLQLGVNPWAKNRKGRTALDLATGRHFDKAEKILENAMRLRSDCRKSHASLIGQPRR